MMPPTPSARNHSSRRPAAGRATTAAAVATALLLAALPCRSQTAGTRTAGARAAAGTRIVSTGPVKVRLWSEKGKWDAVLVGRTETHVQGAPDASGGAPRHEIAQITGAAFPIEYNRFEVMRALHHQDWATAIRLQYKAYEPYFPYLDLPNNNAAEGALELGTTMLRAATRSQREAAGEADRERTRKQFESAYAVFQHCSKATWSSVGLLGSLKGCRCLIGMGKTRAAWFELRSLEEPVPGDAAYGHYWLIQAELHMLTNGYASAMEASVKSLCFENKDVETFPDALLISARCYEALGAPYRARDVYYEVARLFPRTDWSAAATARLRAIMDSGVTREAEATTVESAFLGIDEDMNALVRAYLADQKKPPAATEEETESAVVDREAPAAGR